MIRCKLSDSLEPMVAVEVLNGDGDSRTVEAVLLALALCVIIPKTGVSRLASLLPPRSHSHRQARLNLAELFTLRRADFGADALGIYMKTNPDSAGAAPARFAVIYLYIRKRAARAGMNRAQERIRSRMI